MEITILSKLLKHLTNEEKYEENPFFNHLYVAFKL